METDCERFKAMLTAAGKTIKEGFPFLAPGWAAVTFLVEEGLGGSKEGYVTAFFRHDGSFDSFSFCD